MTRAADETDLITLKQACEEFMAGTVTIASLRAEHRRGNLALYRIGRRDFTTIFDLKEMKERCRVGRKVPGSISIRDEVNGLSAMDRASSALAALDQTTRALKRGSQSISPASTGPRRVLRR